MHNCALTHKARACAMLWPVVLAVVLALPLANARAADNHRLHFVDGESITGNLDSISGGKVKWRSPMLGNLAVNQDNVDLIETERFFDIRTRAATLTHCRLSIVDAEQWLHCDQGSQQLGNWALVIDAGRAEDEKPVLLVEKSTVRIALDDASGNTNVTNYNIDAGTELRYIESRHTVRLLHQNQSNNGDQVRDIWRGTYQYDQFLTEQWFATGNAFYEEDRFRQLDRRTSLGLGMGYQFLETSTVDLLGKVTLNYLDEQFTTGLSRTTPAVLWNLSFAWRMNDSGMELFHRHSMLQSFDSSRDYEINTTTGLKYPINGHFSSIIQYDYDYDNLPAEVDPVVPDKVEKADRKWSIGLNYDW